MEWLGQKQHRQHGLAEQAALRSVFAPPGAPQVQSILCAPSTAASSSSLLTYLRMPLSLLTRHQEAEGTIFWEDCCLSPPPHSIRRADAGPLPSCLHAQRRKPGAGNEKSPPEEPCAIFPASPSAPASRSPPPNTHTHSPALSFSGRSQRRADGVGTALPAPWHARPAILPGFSGLTLAFQRLEVQSRRRAPLAASLFPNIERQREKSRLLPAHQSHHQRGCWPSCPKNNCSATGHACFSGTKGDNAPGATGTEWGGGKKIGLFPPSPLSASKGACNIPEVQVNSTHTWLSASLEKPLSCLKPGSSPPSSQGTSSAVWGQQWGCWGTLGPFHLPTSTAGKDSKPNMESNFWAPLQVQRRCTWCNTDTLSL